MTAGQIRIGIVGGGIGGLTLALALRQRGLTADVYEQASELREIGAAVALAANGTRELKRLGCLDAIAALSTEPSEFIWRGWRDERRVASFPMAKGGAYLARCGAPFFGIHRADLQRVLGAAHGPQRLNLGHRLIGLTEENKVIKLEFANGRSAEVDILAGALKDQPRGRMKPGLRRLHTTMSPRFSRDGIRPLSKWYALFGIRFAGAYSSS